MSLLLNLFRWEEIALVKLIKWVVLFVIGIYITFFILKINDLVMGLFMSFVAAEVLVHIFHDRLPDKYDKPEETEY